MPKLVLLEIAVIQFFRHAKSQKEGTPSTWFGTAVDRSEVPLMPASLPNEIFRRLVETPPTAYESPPTAYETPPTAYEIPPTAYEIPPTAYEIPVPGLMPISTLQAQ